MTVEPEYEYLGLGGQEKLKEQDPDEDGDGAMTEREIEAVTLLSWMCRTLDHQIGGRWVRRGADAAWVCLCGRTETNRAIGFYRRTTA